MDGAAAGVDVELARHRTYAGLKWYAEQKGYKPGWASMKFKAIFGRWPNGEASEGAAAPSEELMRWVKRGNAAYAKEQRKREKDGLAVGTGNGVQYAAGGEHNSVPAHSALMTDEDWDVQL